MARAEIASHVDRIDALLFNSLTAPDSPLRLLTTLRSDHAHWRGHLLRLEAPPSCRSREAMRLQN